MFLLRLLLPFLSTHHKRRLNSAYLTLLVSIIIISVVMSGPVLLQSSRRRSIYLFIAVSKRFSLTINRKNSAKPIYHYYNIIIQLQQMTGTTGIILLSLSAHIMEDKYVKVRAKHLAVSESGEGREGRRQFISHNFTGSTIFFLRKF